MADTVVFKNVGLDAIRRRISAFSDERAKELMARAKGTIARRLPVLAAKLVSEKILNVTKSKVRPLLFARVSGERVILFGLQSRIPLHQFEGTRYGGRKTAGAVVKKWRDSAAETYSAARADALGGLGKGGAFAIKGRGVKGGIYQRVHRVYHSTLAGTNRELITLRKGPSFHRAITDKKHGDIYPELIEASREVVRAELIRLLKLKR